MLRLNADFWYSTSGTALKVITILPEIAPHRGWLAASKGAAQMECLGEALQKGKI